MENGKLREITGPRSEELGILLANERNATLCQLGIGTNYAARVTGIILNPTLYLDDQLILKDGEFVM